MPDVENNMDELFRRAAEGYQLNNAKDNWDKIAPFIEHSIIAANAPHKPKSIRKYSILLLA